MGGKKKSTNDEGLGKTARASALKKGGKKEGFLAAAPEHLDRFVSLGGGTFAYLRDPRDGKLRHLRVGSDSWNSVITELVGTDHGVQILAEIERKGWSYVGE